MQKKLEADLMSIAHGILQMKNRDDLNALKQKAYETYEKLAVLSYIDNYVKETPQNTKSVEELVEQIFSNSTEEVKPLEKMAADEPIKEEVVVTETLTNVIEEDTPKVEEELIKETIKEDSGENKEEEPTKVVNVAMVEEKLEVVNEEETKEVFEEEILPEEIVPQENSTLDLFTKVDKDEIKESTELQSSLEKEFGTTVSLDVATNMFENATRVTPKKSINDVVMNQKNLQIDLNDRIAFVKHLFEGSQEDFNRVVSQLNTMSSEKEAMSFLKMIKKEYHWGGKEIYEDRLILLIERKFN